VLASTKRIAGGSAIFEERFVMHVFTIAALAVGVLGGILYITFVK
jgi:hypothetical protein